MQILSDFLGSFKEHFREQLYGLIGQPTVLYLHIQIYYFPEEKIVVMIHRGKIRGCLCEALENSRYIDLHLNKLRVRL